jgi:hypothetical protein
VIAKIKLNTRGAAVLVALVGLAEACIRDTDAVVLRRIYRTCRIERVEPAHIYALACIFTRDFAPGRALRS